MAGNRVSKEQWEDAMRLNTTKESSRKKKEKKAGWLQKLWRNMVDFSTTHPSGKSIGERLYPED